MTNSLAPLARQKFFDNNGKPLAVGRLFTYANGTTTKQATAKNASGTANTNPIELDARGECDLWLDPSKSFSLTLAPPGTDDPPTNPIWTRDDVAAPLSILTLYNRTDAEIAAGVTPTRFQYPELHIWRYGGTDDGATDTAAAFNSALSVAAQKSGGAIYFPSIIGDGYKFSTGVSATLSNLVLYGDGYKSALFTASDITIFSATTCPNLIVRDMRFQGPGSGSTLPGFLVTDCLNGTMQNVLITLFDKGFQSKQGGGTGSYIWSHNQCQYTDNITINADLQANSNAHTFNNCTLGGGAKYGVRVYDSNSPVFNGGDFEGCVICAADLDMSSSNKMAAVFNGTHFEGNGPTAGQHLGDIRIGNTAAVSGVTVNGCLFSPGAQATYGINAIRGDALNVTGGRLLAGYGSATFETIDAAFGSYNIRGVGGYTVPELSATTPDPGNNGTITTKGTRCARVTPAGNQTGWILQAGTFDGQTCNVLNQGGGSGTFAAYATSHVARGTSVVIPATGSQLFTWDNSAAAWY